jgi:AcrR family transcriptional regulator
MAISLQTAKKDPRVTRTQKLLRDALTSLLKEKSFASISVQDIAERATVNRATFYAPFQDKFDLLESVMSELFREKLTQGDPRSADSVEAALFSLTVNVLKYVDETYGHCRPSDRHFDSRLQRTMHHELRAYLAESFSDVGALVASSAIVGAALEWRREGAQQPADRIARHIVDVLSRGIATEAR